MKKKSFTLIELLVVITVISILAGILLPALQLAREAVKLTICLSNAKQLYAGSFQYSSDYNEFSYYFYRGTNSVSRDVFMNDEGLPGRWRGIYAPMAFLIKPGYWHKNNIYCPANPPYTIGSLSGKLLHNIYDWKTYYYDSIPPVKDVPQGVKTVAISGDFFNASSVPRFLAYYERYYSSYEFPWREHDATINVECWGTNFASLPPLRLGRRPTLSYLTDINSVVKTASRLTAHGPSEKSPKCSFVYVCQDGAGMTDKYSAGYGTPASRFLQWRCAKYYNTNPIVQGTTASIVTNSYTIRRDNQYRPWQ